VSKLYSTLTLALLALVPGLCRADLIFGVYAGAGTWLHETSGDATAGPTEVDLEQDLGLAVMGFAAGDGNIWTTVGN